MCKDSKDAIIWHDLNWNTHTKWSTAHTLLPIKKKLKCSRYRPSVVQRVGTGIALLFHEHGTRRRWVVSNTPRPHFTPRKDQVPILLEAGCAPGPVCTGGKSRLPRDSNQDRPARSQSQYRLSYPAHTLLPVISAKLPLIKRRRLDQNVKNKVSTDNSAV